MYITRTHSHHTHHTHTPPPPPHAPACTTHTTHTHTRGHANTYPTRANHCDAHTNITCTHSVPRPTCIFGFRPGVCDKESAVQSPVPVIASCTPPPAPTPPPIQHISFVAGYLGCFGLQFCLSPLALPSNYLLSVLSPFYRWGTFYIHQSYSLSPAISLLFLSYTRYTDECTLCWKSTE